MSSRCGWCDTGQHSDCVVFVRVTHFEGKRDRNGVTKEWHCKCECKRESV